MTVNLTFLASLDAVLQQLPGDADRQALLHNLEAALTSLPPKDRR